MTRADLGKDPDQVSAMFDRVAARYDRTNNVLSVGNAPLWRVATTKAVAPKAGERILDVAAGTGTSSASLAKSGASVVAADFSPGMIEVGRRRQAGMPNIVFVEADATKLPFGDDEFDAVTISFGLRNVADPDAALAELARVTRPGGRLLVCEFSTPTWAPYRTAYHDVVLKHALPTVARAVSSNPEAYLYLAESIRAWPDQAALAQRIKEAGWGNVAWRNLAGGAVALHRGRRP